MAFDELRTECCRCKCEFVLPNALYVAAKARSNISFFCPYGHEQHFKSQVELDTEEKLRQERDRLKQQLAQKDDEIKCQRDLRLAADRKTFAARGQVTRIKNRAKAGLCPCCNRHFTNLERHIGSKHPDFTKADA